MTNLYYPPLGHINIGKQGNFELGILSHGPDLDLEPHGILDEELTVHHDDPSPFHFNLPFAPGALLGKAIAAVFSLFRWIPVSRQ